MNAATAWTHAFAPRQLAGFFLLAASACTAVAAPRPVAASATVVLPANVQPDSYRIDINPDVAAGRFSATVDVDLRIVQPTDRIVLNSADLIIRRAELSGEQAAPVVVYDDKSQTVAFVFRHRLEPAHRTLHIAYQGRIFDQVTGLFRLAYTTQGREAQALYTQFENADARRFVPCWDEPARKATFTLSSVLPAGEMAVSNMPVDSIDDLDDGRQRVHFQTTPRMSTYLLFYAQGDFERVHRRVGGVDLGVVVKRGDTDRAAYALDAASELLGYYNEYFDLPYPLPKLDMVAAPGSDPLFSAMENWGAILYFERALLADPQLSSPEDRQRVFSVVAHEMAHQWFGNLVTMAWWDGLWLNEGFATWMKDKAAEHLHPQWRPWLRQQQEREVAMREDEHDGTHPVVTPIRDVVEADAAFDRITYAKGAAVVRTIETYLGEDVFRDGVRAYLRDHLYGNAVTDDLWRALDRVAPRSGIAGIAHGLTLQDGVPLVRVRSLNCQDGRTLVTLGEEAFAVHAGAPASSKSAHAWDLPVHLSVLGGASAAGRLTAGKPLSLEAEGCGPVVVNEGFSAYLRVAYPETAWQALRDDFGKLSTEDRIGLLDDAAALALESDLDLGSYLDILDAALRSPDPFVVYVGIAQSEDILHRLAESDALPAWKTYLLSRLRPLRQRLGWDPVAGEPDADGILRSAMLRLSSEAGDEDVIRDMKRRLALEVANPGTALGAVRHDMFRVAGVTADADTWNTLHELAQHTASNPERLELYQSLGSADDLNLARRTLDLALTGELPATFRPELVMAVASAHPDLGWEFVRDHWADVASWIEPNSRGRFAAHLLGQAQHRSIATDFQAFASQHLAEGNERDLRKAIGGVMMRKYLHEKLGREIGPWVLHHAD